MNDATLRERSRNLGIGEQLMHWAVAEARANGCKLVELLTHNTRVNAQRFYERLGFTRVGARRFRVGHSDYDDLVLALDVG